ncbi:MAG: SAM-dependent methyltransferase [Clostridia bacterium]|nr:SAM-dependent methyltransferase [Clostridia bacterium]
MTHAVGELQELLALSIDGSAFKKAVFSKPDDQAEQKTVLTLRRMGGRMVLQAERFCSDNKALHENLPADSVQSSKRIRELITSHGQVNLLTTAGDCEYRRSKKGENAVLLGAEKLRRRLSDSNHTVAQPTGNNRQKNHILAGDEPFLKHLGISDQSGRIHDKKQPKFRQINRFLELLRDCIPSLPETGTLRVCDLCCGKSYLSFAIYHYLTNVLHRDVRMTGVDLKPDVVEHCNSVAHALQFHGLEFLCGDVAAYDTGEKVHLVVSLHACDVATDLVLERAVSWNTDVILSTPCCHHELNHAIDCSPLSFITDHSMLRQKLCDAATDALRLKFLEAHGYRVCALELIDPDETPKNIMLRGLRRAEFDKNSPAASALLAEYEAARSFLTGGKNNVQQLLFPSVRQ